MRRKARSHRSCLASVRPAWPRLANCFWRRRLASPLIQERRDKQNEETPMKAAVLYEVNKPLVIEDVSLPNPGPREVLIRTAVAGLCHSDLHFIEVLYPHPLPALAGQKSAGVVPEGGAEGRDFAGGEPRGPRGSGV